MMMMSESRKRALDDDDDDEMDTDGRETAGRARSDHEEVYLTTSGVVTRRGQRGMVVTWKDQRDERIFEDSVIFATAFGAQMAVGYNGQTVLWYRHLRDFEPIEITGFPALDIIGFCVVGDRTDIWIAATQDPELTLLQWSHGSVLVPSGGRYSYHGNFLYVWHMFGDCLSCRTVDTVNAIVTENKSGSLGPFPVQLMPTAGSCVVLRFGAPSCQVLSTGEAFPLRHCPYVGLDYVIHNGAGDPLGRSPLGPVPQWIWGNLWVNFLVLTQSGTVTFYSIRSESADSSTAMSLT